MDEIRAIIAPDPQVEALDQWEPCERVMRGERQILDRMSPEGRRVVGLLGGPVALGQTHLDGVHWVRREFLAAYQTMATATELPMLEGPEVTPESRRIVGEVPHK